MKRIFLLVFSIVISLTSKAGTPQTIAVYNVDSVIAVMPEYPAALKKYITYDSLINAADSMLEKEYQARMLELSTDSLKWSPTIRELKKKELYDIGERVHEFRIAVVEDRVHTKKELLAPLEQKINEAVIATAKEKGFAAVISNRGYPPVMLWDNDSRGRMPISNMRYEPSLLTETLSQPLVYTDAKARVINITALLIEKLKK